MIFSSFGNVPYSFDRLAKALDSYAKETGEKIIIQTGHTRYNFCYVEHYAFLNHEQMLDYIKNSDLCILQGGWGTISECIFAGKRIIAVPRILGKEHNHPQEEIVRMLETMGCLIGCYNIVELPNLIKKARSMEFKPLLRGNATQFINPFLDNIK